MSRAHFPEHTAIQCAACQASLWMARVTPFQCPLCGASQGQPVEDMVDAPATAFFLPPVLTSEQRIERILQWLGRPDRLHPETLKTEAQLSDSLERIMLPYWIFSATVSASWRARVRYDRMSTFELTALDGHHDAEERYDWKQESGQVDLGAQHSSIAAHTWLKPLYRTELGTFTMTDITPLDTALVSGWHALGAPLSQHQAWQDCEDGLEKRAWLACRNDHDGDLWDDESIRYTINKTAAHFALLPLYITHYTYQNKRYPIFVNANTGAVSGGKPVLKNQLQNRIMWKMTLPFILIMSGICLLPLFGFGLIPLIWGAMSFQTRWKEVKKMRHDAAVRAGSD